MLSAKGDFTGAKRELTIALIRNPKSGRAHDEQGAVRAQSGDNPGAIEHLTIAARDADPNIRAAANEMLRRLRLP